METVFLRTTAPVCTVAKYSAQDSTSKPTAKAGNWIKCCFPICSFKALLQRPETDKVYIFLTVSVIRVSGIAKRSLVLESARFMEMDTSRPLTPTGTALVDSVGTCL